MTVMPTPMAVMPAAAPMPMHLLRLQLCGLLAAGNGGTRVRVAARQVIRTFDRPRRQRRGLHAGRKDRRTGGSTKCKLQEISALHDIFLWGDC
jgi:hypothetical protein